ncbi:hypothetical protein BpHYR1_015206, partial [Brachionus plicatilis]
KKIFETSQFFKVISTFDTFCNSNTKNQAKSVIDLIITTEDIHPKTTDFSTNHSYNIFDHWPVQINIILKKPVQTTQITDWDIFNNFSRANPCKFNSNIEKALPNGTKSVKTKERSIKLPPDVKAMIRIKVKLQRLFSNTQSQLTKITSTTSTTKSRKNPPPQTWNSTFATLIDSKPRKKQFWNKLKTKTESTGPLPNSTLKSDEKAETFAKHFEKTFTTNSKSKPKPSLFIYHTTNKNKTPISNTELERPLPT